MEKIRVDLPIIVEGKYDKIALSSVLEGQIFTTDGFGLFRKEEKAALLRRLAKDGILILTDSDGGGRQIRSFLSGILPKGKVHHLYIPQIPGKERRKKAPGKAGLLGVEGMDASLLRQLFLPFSQGAAPKRQGEPVTKQDLYADGLSGREGSEEARRRLGLAMDLPGDMTANALLAAINLLYTKQEYEAFLRKAGLRQEEPPAKQDTEPS